MGSRTHLVKRTASKKGWGTALAGAGTAAAFFAGWWVIGLVGAGATGYLGYKWLRYRGKWGLRF